MRKILASEIKEIVADLCVRVNCDLPLDVLEALETARNEEKSASGVRIIDEILENSRLAKQKRLPMCQDTGLILIFVDLGEEICLIDDLPIEDNICSADLNIMDVSSPIFSNYKTVTENKQSILERALNSGVSLGYIEGKLRKSVVTDPLFNRFNTNNNTPAIIHVRIVPGKKILITLAPKGGGCENKSFLRMLNPADGVEGVRSTLLQAVHEAGAGACPPFIIGIGIGGNSELAMLNAKRASLAGIYSSHADCRYAELEKELLDLVNNTGIGPQGLGGLITALKVNIEYAPAHIASLPVAVSINCHAARHVSVEI